jgi:hypothetical protein
MFEGYTITAVKATSKPDSVTASIATPETNESSFILLFLSRFHLL